MTKQLLTCKHCGKEFQATHGRQLYCDGPCVRAAGRDYRRNHSTTFTRERRQVSSIVQSALVRGVLVSKPCEVCGVRRNVDAHHDDYARPLDIRWLCRRHHQQHHAKHGPGLNAFRAEEIA